MISSVFKKIGKGKVLAVVEQSNDTINASSRVENFKSEESDNLVTVIEMLRANAFSVAPSKINESLHGHLAHKPISLNSEELRIIVGARSHIDYALECTITDLKFLAEKDINSACMVAEQITEIFISKSGTLREAALMDVIAIGTLRKFKAFLTHHHETMKTLNGMDKISAVVDLINELRRIQGRLVDSEVIAHFCRILDTEILPLDILGPRLRFGITDSLYRFYMNKIEECSMIIGINHNHGALNLCANSDANIFIFLRDNIDNNTNKSVIKRMNEMKCQELNNLFEYGSLNVNFYNASHISGSIKALNRYNHADIKELIEKTPLEVVDSTIDYEYSTIENFENIRLRAFAKEYQNDSRFNAKKKTTGKV